MSLDSNNKRLDELFASAARHLSAPGPSQSLGTKVKLEIYGLYKVVMNGPQPPSSRPSIFDQVGRAKWDAWSAAGKTWCDASGNVRREAAQSRYLEIARSIGWEEDLESTAPPRRSNDSIDLNRLDEDDETPMPLNGASSGMGTRVSTMALEGPSGTESLHDWAAEGDLVALRKHLDSRGGRGVNERNSDGYTALHLASDRGHLEVVEFLVRAKADQDLKDPDGLTARELAELAGRDSVVEHLRT